ncbi:glutamate--cysteine ligase [Marinobacterium arenosum]|uniref:glutamate--cysteine ligase n=1 Tax=Marinobacterium arenosum TaxID=2862496 RepID=UPI001C953D0C|nr:glutamate--cysteine ligase [Marinobacterium arenosum]MBY4675598.1 glutamate--cysteine ligase [Marinobacterium arenosum]
MSAALENTLAWLRNGGHAPLLKGILHGIEKEGLRVDASARLAQTPHPISLGSALTHDHITTDYSEALLEFITPAFTHVDEALEFLADLHSFTLRQLGDEELWCASMPCPIPGEEAIPIARYGSSNIGRMKHIYRVGLQHRYGKMMQTIAGIHYNFSLPEALWPLYQQRLGNHDSLQDFRSAGYFKLIRNFRRHSWLLLYLFGASPALSASFMGDKPHQLQSLDSDTLYLPYATSLRMSDLGYSNKAQASLNICFNQLPTYAASLHRAIQTPYPGYERIGIKVDGQYRQLNANILQIENEYYSDIRPKRITHSGEKPIHALMSRGVEYIEVRNTDINPFLPLGIDREQSDFIDLFLLSCLFDEDGDISNEECELISENHERVTTRGREPGLMLQTMDSEISLQDWGHQILDRAEQVAELLDDVHRCDRYRSAVASQRAKLADPEQTPSAQLLNVLRDERISHTELVLRESQRHRTTLLNREISEKQQTHLSGLVGDSLRAQAELEAGDTIDFDQFLTNYMTQ